MNYKILILFYYLNISVFAQKGYYIEDDLKYTYSAILEDINKISVEFQPFVTVDTIGYSEFNLPIITLKISSGNSTLKKSIWLVGNIHAREDYSSKFVMKFANVFLLSLCGLDNTYTNASTLLETYDIYVSPVVNPDGLKIAHQDWTGIEQFKDSVLNIKCVDGLVAWKANGKGIDFDRTAYCYGCFCHRHNHYFCLVC